MNGRMAGKVVVITGAARGIGRGCAELLATEGACVVIGDLDAEAGETAAAAIRAAKGDALFQPADVTREEQCSSLMTSAVGEYGRLDALVNNAGWFPRGTLEETSAELWDQVLDVNLRGAFFCCKHAVPHLRAAGGGSIVNVGSTNGIQAMPNLVAYGAAKGGLLAMTRTLAGAALPLGRPQTVQDMAFAVLYLASDESSQVTGAVLNVDAGASMLPVYREGGYVG